MGLQVWLPLNGNLDSQGLADLTRSFNMTTINDDGKIGKCYYVSGIIYHLTNEIIQNQWTLCTWVKSSSWSTSNDIIMCKNISESTHCQFYFSIINGNVLNLGINGGSDTNAKYSYTFNTNTWYHVAATYDGVNYSLYINGEMVKTGTRQVDAFTDCNNLGIGCRSLNANGTSYTSGQTKYLNDVRIYDTALSPREVKEISKGLVLHYPLSMPGQENLLKNSHHKCDNNGYYVGTYAFVDSSKLETGKTYTLSFNGELQDDTQTGWYFNIFPSPYTEIINKPTYKEGRFAFSFVMPENGGNRTSIGCYSLPLGNKLGCAIWDVKLEEGSTATPWTPAPSDGLYSQMGLDNNIEYDVSGYGNNGIRVGNITSSINTPRYITSSVFNGSSYIKNTDFNLSHGIWTVAAWYYLPNTLSSYNCILCLSKGDGSDVNKKFAMCPNNSYIWFKLENTSISVNSALKVNQWTHITLTSDGINGKVYVNGQQVATTNIASINSDYTDLVIGARANAENATTIAVPLSGLISDVRIYATALSADDILELYHTPETLTNNGTLLGYEYVET